MSTAIPHPPPTENGPASHASSRSSSTGSSPPPPKALLSSSADLSPGIPVTTPQPSSPSKEDPADLRTPRARQTSARLFPPDRPSRPTSTSSFISTSSLLSIPSLTSPLCTPKVRDYAYPKSHKYHAPSFNSRRVSVSSRSSTSSDIDSFFPQRIGGQFYLADEDAWKRGSDEEDAFEVDGEDEELVERRAVCVFDFSAECDGEISIEIGQVVWVEFRKGVSGWLVVRDEITESKGLVPEGYVRFLNGDEERQYLAQSPPTNTLLPREPISSGEDTPKPVAQMKQQWPDVSGDNDDWIDEPEGINKQVQWGIDDATGGVENVRVE